MAQTRKRSPARGDTNQRGRVSAQGWRSWIGALRPDLSGRGLGQLGARAVIAAGSVAIMAALASWTSSGFIRRGELSRMVAMKNGPPQESAPAAKGGGLDRARLNAVASAAAR